MPLWQQVTFEHYRICQFQTDSPAVNHFLLAVDDCGDGAKGRFIPFFGRRLISQLGILYGLYLREHGIKLLHFRVLATGAVHRFHHAVKLFNLRAVIFGIIVWRWPANLAVDLTGKKVGDQIRVADKKGLRYVIIIGEKELEDEQFTLKDLKNGSEEKHSLERIVSIVKDHRHEDDGL